MSLAEQIILVRLTRKYWRGNVTDFGISDEVITAKNADRSAGVFVKRVMDNTFFRACTSAYRAIDTYHKKMTVPWNDRAERALPATMYFKYTDRMRGLIADADAKVGEFATNLGDLVLAEQKRLGDAFNPEDYPSAEQLKSKYGVDLQFYPLQNLDDIRVALPEEEKAQLRLDCESMFSEKLAGITGELWKRLYDAIKRMVDNLEKNSRIYDTMIGNIQELVTMLPTLNVANDQKLAYMAREIEDRICSWALRLDDIRHDDKVRAQAHDDAQDVLDKIDSMIGGWK